MYISKVLKRKDAPSVSIAVVMAIAFTYFLAAVSSQPAVRLAGLGNNPNYRNSMNWQESYLVPFMTLVVELVLLEISVRLIVWLRPLAVRKK